MRLKHAIRALAAAFAVCVVVAAPTSNATAGVPREDATSTRPVTVPGPAH